MAAFKVGIQLQPQGTTIASLLDGAVTAEQLGVDSVWTWDHFFPLFGDPDAAHFEGYTVLAAMAARTERVSLGALVTCNSYRNPNLLADMARTIDHISEGRFVLGVGAGWFERDYDEYGYEFGTARERLDALGESLPVIRDRIAKLKPAPVGPLPIMVGGSGRNVTLRLVARHADAWNSFGPPEDYAELNGVLDRWCEREGRDPTEIERTVAIGPSHVRRWEEYLDAGATHIIVMTDEPFDFDAVAELLDHASGAASSAS